MKKIAIVGAGASGAICAYHLLNAGHNVNLFDKKPPLTTLLPTGGGRCNLAHAEYDFKALASNYPRGEKFLYSVFSKFSTLDTIKMFNALGVKTYTQPDGRIFPKSDSAKKVRESILKKISSATFTQDEVFDIKELLNNYDAVILAIGGHSGYKLLEPFNINIISPKPSLVGLNTREDMKFLSGSVVKNAKSCGFCDDLLFTHFGISGPLAFKISSINAFSQFPYKLVFNLAPQLTNLQEILNSSPHKTIKNILNDFLPNKIVMYLLKGLDETTKAHQINGKTRDLILNKIREFEVSITGTNKGEETVTAGGIDLNEINQKTMELKKIPNLYCIGEVLNIDGFCGGFNLQNAWSTAYVCAEAICYGGNLH